MLTKSEVQQLLDARRQHKKPKEIAFEWKVTPRTIDRWFDSSEYQLADEAWSRKEENERYWTLIKSQHAIEEVLIASLHRAYELSYEADSFEERSKYLQLARDLYRDLPTVLKQTELLIKECEICLNLSKLTQ